MQLGAPRAVLLAALLAGLRGEKGRLLSGQLVCRGGTQRPCYKVLYFHDASRKLNFEEARAACRTDGGQLVSIESEDEQRLIEKFIENLMASDGDFWIGLWRREEKQSNSTACKDLYTWTDGSISTFRNWYVDEPSCGSEVCVVMYHQPSAPTGIGGRYMFQWNDDRCNMKNNFICKYSDGERTKPATPILPENTEEEDVKETFKENKEAAWNLAYLLVPGIPLLLLLLVTAVVCWVWIWRRRYPEKADVPTLQQKNEDPVSDVTPFDGQFNMNETREQPGPSMKEPPRTLWPLPGRANSPDLEVYKVIQKQSEADLAETRPDLKNISFRGCSGEATPDALSCDSEDRAVNPSESGFVTLASIESGFVTNDIYEFSPDHRLGRSQECGWVENEIYGY